MDEATTNIQRDMPLYMFFADDVVLVEESRVCRGRQQAVEMDFGIQEVQT
jgi:hypothetical protein